MCTYYIVGALGTFFLVLSLNIISGEQCEDLLCSNVFDYVCGMVKYEGSIDVMKYQNICHLEKIKCRLGENADVSQVPDELCGLKKDSRNSRRASSITGTYQVCNHTCPTYCTDAYEPVCANFKRGEKVFNSRVMVNHCHVDLFSCAVGVNVTIHPLLVCVKNANRLVFMKHVAAMTTLKLLGRRSNDEDITKYFFSNILKNIMSEEQGEVNIY